MSNQTRPPIVVVMGHIDHGKSTLLDYIRKTNVVDGETGGITQAISAYQTEKITFLDTPGHAAFTGMRERGVNIADLAILVVSAEEGVKTQTLEALDDILDAKLPFIVAINKIDRPNSNPELIKQQLAEKNVLLEGYGGTIPVMELSAKTGANVPELLELLSLLAEIQDLSADPTAPATGFVLEANLDQRVGVSATLIIKNGTLNTGDLLVIAGVVSKVKRLNNFAGVMVKTLPPSSPAQVVSLTELPPVGATFQAFSDKRAAEQFATEERANREKIKPEATKPTSATPENAIEISLILKADVAGSLEALEKEINKLSNEQTRIKIVSTGVGRIGDNDIKLAGATRGAIVLGFKTSLEKNTTDLVEKLKVEVATFDIIYKLSEWLEEKIKSKQPKREEITVIGRAKLLKVFGSDKDRQVIGGVVTSGRMVLGKTVKVIRRDNEVARGKILELQQQKLPTKEVAQDHQFGSLIETKLPLASGDTLEILEITEH
ncbi:translation initiation factor IF-2 [Candidatus Nomurabacteria bacterium]|nr:translation initiation factor IF-2 [Candidatus Nomurabacteria bacterium]